MSIHIPHWFKDPHDPEAHPGFQHYSDREPIWIKNYTRLLSDEAYRKLTLPQRGTLHGLWLEYARSGRELPDDTASISSRLGVRIPRATLDALNHAGFILLPASSTLAPRYQPASPEKSREEKTVRKGRNSGDDDLGTLGELIEQAAKATPRKVVELDPRIRKRDGTSRYTGCRQTRGQGGFGYVRDPLGIDLPPKDWPHPLPTNTEILEARRSA